jgi:hypothetical protein
MPSEGSCLLSGEKMQSPAERGSGLRLREVATSCPAEQKDLRKNIKALRLAPSFEICLAVWLFSNGSPGGSTEAAGSQILPGLFLPGMPHRSSWDSD